MAKKKRAVVRRFTSKTTSGTGKTTATKSNPKALSPVITGTEPSTITLSKENFWFTVIGSNLNNPAIYNDTNVLVFTDEDTPSTYNIPNDKVSFSDMTPGQFVVKVTGISRRSIELRGSGKLTITILAGLPALPRRRGKATYEPKATIPN